MMLAVLVFFSAASRANDLVCFRWNFYIMGTEWERPNVPCSNVPVFHAVKMAAGMEPIQFESAIDHFVRRKKENSKNSNRSYISRNKRNGTNAPKIVSFFSERKKNTYLFLLEFSTFGFVLQTVRNINREV